MEYIPYHCGFQGNTYTPQEVELLPGDIYIAHEVSLTSWGIYISSRKSADFKKLPPTRVTPPYEGGEAGFTESEAEVAFEEIAAIL